MKKIIFTMVLGLLLPAMGVAKDTAKHMMNADPNASLMSKKHMMNADPNASLMSKKHMMNTSPYSSSSKDAAGAVNKNKQGNKGYTVIKYQKK